METPLVRALRSAFDAPYNQEGAVVGLHEPRFTALEKQYLTECLDSTFVSSVGPFVDRFEKMLCDITGSKFAVAASSGTSALHIALLLAGVQRDDEVLIPALSFVATANAVAYCGAVPHFVDSERIRLGVASEPLAEYLASEAQVVGGVCRNRRTGRVIRALVPMHAYGHPVDLDALAEITEKFSIVLVEDAAESLGSTYRGQHTGLKGKLAALSFNGNKVVTTGGGGAILTQDEALAKRAKHLTTTAKRPHAWEFFHDEVGYNYRLPNLNAALGCAQLERFPQFLKQKRVLAGRVKQALEKNASSLRLVEEPQDSQSNYWLLAALIQSGGRQERDQLLQELNSQKVMARPTWNLLHTLPMYRHCPRMELQGAEWIENHLINLPSSPFLAGGVENEHV